LVVGFCAFDRRGVAEGVAEDLGEEGSLELGFVELVELAGGFEIGPTDEDRVRVEPLLLVLNLLLALGFEEATKN
jgi:hypothetical protein